MRDARILVFYTRNTVLYVSTNPRFQHNRRGPANRGSRKIIRFGFFDPFYIIIRGYVYIYIFFFRISYFYRGEQQVQYRTGVNPGRTETGAPATTTSYYYACTLPRCGAVRCGELPLYSVVLIYPVGPRNQTRQSRYIYTRNTFQYYIISRRSDFRYFPFRFFYCRSPAKDSRFYARAVPGEQLLGGPIRRPENHTDFPKTFAKNLKFGGEGGGNPTARLNRHNLVLTTEGRTRPLIL